MALAETDIRTERHRAQGTDGSVSLADLVRELRNEFTLLVRQEVALAKTEATEKVSRFARNGVFLAAGGMVAYAGLIILLLGASAGLYVGLVAAGLSHATSGWLAPLIVGATVALVGLVLIQKAISTMRNESVLPERTVHTLQEDKDWVKRKVQS
jgi:cytochrome c biogenesis protein ResB